MPGARRSARSLGAHLTPLQITILPQRNSIMAIPSARGESLAQSLNKSFPPALMTLVQEVVQPVPDFGRIGQTIKSDPILTANILSLVNSPFYGLNQKIVDLKRAAIILGTREILKILLSCSYFHTLSRQDNGLENIRVWRGTIWSTLAAQSIAEHLCPDQADTAYISALLKDVSMLLLRANNEGHSSPCPGSAADKRHVPDAPPGLETPFPGQDVDHAALSSELLAYWELPADIQAAVATHHDLDRIRDLTPLQQCVALGAHWADMELAPTPDALALLQFKHLVQELLPLHEGYEPLRESVVSRFTELARILRIEDHEADDTLLNMSIETIQRLFFLSLELSQSSGGLTTQARIFQKHLRHQWEIRTWELALAWPREQRWSLFRCHLGANLHEAQTYIPRQDITWTYTGENFPLMVNQSLWGELCIPGQQLSSAAADQLRHYAHFAAMAMEQYAQRTAVLEDKAGILDRLPVGVARLESNGQVMEANPSMLRLLGTEAESGTVRGTLHGQDILPALIRTGMITSRTAWNDFIQSAHTSSFSSLNCPSSMNPDIRTPCLYLSAHKLQDGVREGILVLLEDIQDISELQFNLRKQRDFLRGMINAMRDVVLTVNAQGVITFTSAQLPRDIIGKNLFLLSKPVEEPPEPWDAHQLGRTWGPIEIILFLDEGLALPLEFIFSSLPAQQREPEYLVVGRDLTSIRRLEEKLRRQAMVDELTDLFNHRRFWELLGSEIKRAQRANHPLSLLFFDLDKFKAVNDTLGHQAGDRILRRVGQVLRKTCRAGVDFPARYGGDEFIVLSSDTSAEQMAHLAQRIMRMIEEDNQGQIGLSIGIAQYIAPESAEEFLNRADRAAYQAKQAGGGRAVVAPEPDL